MSTDETKSENDTMTRFTFNLSEKTKKKLVNIAETQKTVPGSILRRLANRYTTFGNVVERRKEISLPREIVKILFEDISDDKLNKIVEVYYNIASNDLELRYTKVDVKAIQNGLLSWAKFSDHNFEILHDGKNGNEFWIVCKHDLGIKWSDAIERVMTKLLENGNNGMLIKEDMKKTEFLFKMHYRVSAQESTDRFQN